MLSTNAVTATGASSDNQEIVYHELCGNGQVIAKVSTDSISIQKLYESNEKAVSAIFLDRSMKEAGAFASLQEKTLQAIASQCPLVGGDVVYAARSLYRFIEPKSYFDDYYLCGRDSLPQMLQQEEIPYQSLDLNLPNSVELHTDKVTVLVYPNPAQEVLHLAFSKAPEREVELRLLSMEGRLMERRIFGGGGNVLSHSTGNFESGMYVLQIRIGAGETISTRVVIIKIIV